MKKKYVHIKEYYLTKLVLDNMDIDIEDDGRLYYGALPLKYKSRYFTLVDYKDFNKFNDKEMVPIRPFTNTNHAHYLINMFSDIKDCDTLFEYSVMEEDKDLLKGTIKLTFKNKVDTVTFYGTRNLATLMGGILLKLVCKSNSFYKNIKDIMKVDSKLTELKNAQQDAIHK